MHICTFMFVVWMGDTTATATNKNIQTFLSGMFVTIEQGFYEQFPLFLSESERIESSANSSAYDFYEKYFDS